MKTFVQKLVVRILFLSSALVVAETLGAQQSNSPVDERLSSQYTTTASVININDWVIWTQFDGSAGHNPWTGEVTKFPRGTATVLYQDGLIWGGYVNETGTPQLRVGGYDYRAGTIPGAILAPGVAEDWTASGVRVYRIRKDYATADLRLDASDLLNKPIDQVTNDDLEHVRSQYQKDWQEWPAEKGAPFYDDNLNGVRDSGEEPGLLDADMVLWFVINDLDSAKTMAFYGTDPIGLEVQITWWAYKPTSAVLRNSLFMRYRIVYKGTGQSTPSSTIREMHLSKKVDGDIGSFFDDLVGCDTTLSLGFEYNSSGSDAEFAPFHMIPPAVGFALLQGPLVSASPTEVGIFNFEQRKGYTNLPMTSFIGKYTGSPYSDPPLGTAGTRRIYNWIRGYQPFDDIDTPLWYRDHTNKQTKFMFTGDPVAGTGWIDGLGSGTYSLAPGDRRLLLNTGPFTMSRGDTQEVVYALVGGPGSDARRNVNIVKYFTRLIRAVYPNLSSLPYAEPPRADLPTGFSLSHVYPNPLSISGDAPMTIRYLLPMQSDVEVMIYDVLGRRIRTLVRDAQPPGAYTVRWGGLTAAGTKVAGGVYFIRLRAWIFERVRKIAVIQ